MPKKQTNSILLVVGVAAGGWLAFKLYQDAKSTLNGAGNAVYGDDMPRGIKNNNPLNIEFNKNNSWVGQIGHDGRFSKFSHSKYGIRAAAKLLSNYMTKYKLTTVADIIGRWAPSAESANHTANYVKYVAGQLGVSQDTKIDKSSIPKLVKAMTYFENGKNPYSDAHIISSCELAGIYGKI